MRLEVLVDGMLAVHARHALFTALGAVSGLVRAEVELGRVEVELAPEAAREAVEAGVRAAAEGLGFRVTAVRALPRALPTL
ncbi:MAG: hypothetical protein WD771_09210 [Gemmatimonadaceae bacterium]